MSIITYIAVSIIAILGIIGVASAIRAAMRGEIQNHDSHFSQMIRQRNLDYFNNPIVEHMKRQRKD